MTTKTALPDEGSRSAVARILSSHGITVTFRIEATLRRHRALPLCYYATICKEHVSFGPPLSSSGMAPPSHSYRVSPLI